jgi:hypothetical protein
MLVALCAVVLAQPAAPKDLPQLVKLINASYQKLHGFRDTWSFKNGDGNVLKFNRTMDGDRYHEVVLVDDVEVCEAGYNEKASFGICFPLQIYAEGIDTRAAKPEPPQRTDAGSFTFRIEEHGFTIQSNPQAKIVSVTSQMESGKRVRQVVAKAVNPVNGHSAKIDMILWPNDWVLTDIKITLAKRGKPDEVHNYACKIETGLHMEPSEFRLTPSKVPGYQKLSIEDYTKQAASYMGG